MEDMIELRAWERGLALRRHFSKLFVSLASLTLYLQQSADYGLNTDFDCRPKGDAGVTHCFVNLYRPSNGYRLYLQGLTIIRRGSDHPAMIEAMVEAKEGSSRRHGDASSVSSIL